MRNFCLLLLNLFIIILIQSEVYAITSTTPISEIRNIITNCAKDFEATKAKFDQWVPGSLRSSIKTGGSILSALKQKLSSSKKAEAEKKKNDVKSKIDSFNKYFQKESNSWISAESVYMSTKDMAKENENQLLSLGKENTKKESSAKFLDTSSASSLRKFKNKCKNDLNEINSLIGK